MKLLNEILGTKYPIIQGGMANIATGEFAAACSNAGALGIIGAGGMNADTLRQNIRRCKELTDKPFGVNIMLMLSLIHILEVHVSLRGACGEHACRTLAGNAQCAAAALLAAHGKHHSLCLILAQAAAGGGGDDTILRQAQHRGAGLVRDLTLVHFINERLCIFRAGQALAEAAQTETVMDALAQDAAQHRLTLQNDHVADALLVQLHRCGKTCRAAADNHNVFQMCIRDRFCRPGFRKCGGRLRSPCGLQRRGAVLPAHGLPFQRPDLP